MNTFFDLGADVSLTSKRIKFSSFKLFSCSQLRDFCAKVKQMRISHGNIFFILHEGILVIDGTSSWLLAGVLSAANSRGGKEREEFELQWNCWSICNSNSDCNAILQSIGQAAIYLRLMSQIQIACFNSDTSAHRDNLILIVCYWAYDRKRLRSGRRKREILYCISISRGSSSSSKSCRQGAQPWYVISRDEATQQKLSFFGKTKNKKKQSQIKVLSQLLSTEFILVLELENNIVLQNNECGSKNKVP